MQYQLLKGSGIFSANFDLQMEFSIARRGPGLKSTSENIFRRLLHFSMNLHLSHGRSICTAF